MAADSYHVGTDGSEIILNVRVSTAGIAFSKAQLFVDKAGTDIPNCDCDDDGDIIDCQTGVNTDIKGKMLGIATSVDLETVDPSLWQTMYDNLVIKYTLSGGTGGKKTFNYADEDKSKDPTGQFIQVNKFINLI
ncbi:MAG TPA: hypothetical protein VKR53_03355 [Puia sp.]|nr:hypothetical protein [Puia sp.]